MDEHFQFDREKFKDVVHFAIFEVETIYGRQALGNVKLHKVLFLADILAYLATMRPLTGADYKRQTFGAGASDLRSATAELVTEGRIGVAVVDYFGYSKKDYKSLTKPKSNRLSENECNLIREVVNSVCGNQASEIGDFNCQMVWSSVPIGDRIPYYAAFALFPAELTDEDIADAVQQAHQIAPLILAEFAHDRGVL